MIYSNNNIILENTSFLEFNFFEEIDRWKTHNQNHMISKFKSNSISDEDYEKVRTFLQTMRSTDSYEEYKKAFDRFCRFCHILPRGVIIRKYELKRGKEDHNLLYVEYTYNTKKMQLPEGTILYHMSSVGGINELKPFFRGKAARGYLYDKPRIYFTIRKNMPKFLADYRKNEKLHMYVCKENIKNVYVDPLVWSNLQGAVYVESNKPIRVEEVTETKVSDMLKKLAPTPPRDKEVISNMSEGFVSPDDEFNFDHLFGFVTESGLIIDE